MAETGAGDSSSPDRDRDFEPSAESLVHDYDDEGTMEEEENLSSESGDNEELDDLQKESDMPLEDVLAMYGYGPAEPAADGENREVHSSSSEEEILNNQDLTLDKEEIARDILKNDDGSETSTIDELIENVDPTATSQLINGTSIEEDIFDPDDDEDEDYLPTLDDEMWKKAIQIGDEFQADIPALSAESVNNISDSTNIADERLLWDPEVLAESDVIRYLGELTNGEEVSPPDQGHARDDEQALYTLLQSDFNVEEAVRRKKLQTTPPTDPLSLWSEDECQNFESGLRVYGKNFFAIHQNKVRTRSVGELVQFYYFWKKTERREAFCNRGRIEKKKPSVTPGITDYTDRFIDKADSDEDSVDSLSLDCSCDPTQITAASTIDTDHTITTHISNVENPSNATMDSNKPISDLCLENKTTNVELSAELPYNNVPTTIVPVTVTATPNHPAKRCHPDTNNTKQEMGYNNDHENQAEDNAKRLRIEQVSYPQPSATAEVGN